MPRLAWRWRVFVAALLVGYFVAGVFGRFPWKADEPYAFGILWEMVMDHTWLVPTVVHQPFVEKPPLVYWLGAAFVKLLPGFPAFEASRIAILLLVLVTASSLAGCAHALRDEAVTWMQAGGCRGRSMPGTGATRPPDAGLYALLALLLMAGTIGFAEQLHKLTVDLGQLAGSVLVLCGVALAGRAGALKDESARWIRKATIAGMLEGTGAGIAFMSKGLFVPSALAVTTIGCLCIPAYRNRRAAIVLLVAAAGALPWLVIWPTWFHHASPALFREWLFVNNIGRFVGSAALGGNNVPTGSRVVSMLVMGFPSIVLAAWVALSTIARRRARSWRILRDAPAHVAVATYLGVSLAALGASASMRDVYLLPALPAMVLLGLPALALPRPARRNIAAILVDIAFMLIAAIVIVVWLGLVLRGDVPGLPGMRSTIARYLPLPFKLPLHGTAVVLGAGVLVVWRQVVRRNAYAGAWVAWCAGIAMTWVLASLLLLPWIDAARSYDALFRDVKRRVSAQPGCVATLNLGESELALLEYVTRVTIIRSFLGHSGVGDISKPNRAAEACRWLLVLSNGSSGPIAPDARYWFLVWSGARPADRGENFGLYRSRE